jgi:hypothetical protein
MFDKRLLYTLLLILPMMSMPLSFADYVPPPRQQTASGVSAENIVCSDGLVLIKEVVAGHTDCVKSQTAEKLVERNWAKILPSVNVHKPIQISIIAAWQNMDYFPSIIKSIQKIINDCTYSEIYPVEESIQLNKTNNQCNVIVSGGTEAAFYAYQCSVPLDEMKTWTNWNNPTVFPPTPPFYKQYCRR